MGWFCVFFTMVLLLEVSGLILPLTKQDGSIDIHSVVNHITLLEQTVTGFQKTTSQLQIDLQVTKSDLQTTKSDLQTTKAELQKTQADLKDQQRHSDAEISSLKDELAAVKAEVVMTSDEVISAKSEVATLTSTLLSLQASMNQTLLDSISHDVKSNMANIKSVKEALAMTNYSLEHFVTDINNFNRNTTAVTTELHKQQQEVKSDISTLSSNLAQIQSNVTFTVSDFNQVKDSVTVVQTQLITTTSDMDLIKSDLANIRRNVSGLEAATQSITQISQTTKAELETAKSSLQDQQKQSTSVHNSINNQLQTIKSDLALKAKPVAFHALLSTPAHIAPQPVKFDIVQYNEGNGYNTSTGRFTAPVSGTYLFSAEVELHDTSKSQYTHLRIMKSGSYMAVSYVKSSPTGDDVVMIPVTTVMYVRQEEEVWVQSDENVQVDYANQFVGALVSAY